MRRENWTFVPGAGGSLTILAPRMAVARIRLGLLLRLAQLIGLACASINIEHRVDERLKRVVDVGRLLITSTAQHKLPTFGEETLISLLIGDRSLRGPEDLGEPGANTNDHAQRDDKPPLPAAETAGIGERRKTRGQQAGGNYGQGDHRVVAVLRQRTAAEPAKTRDEAVYDEIQLPILWRGSEPFEDIVAELCRLVHPLPDQATVRDCVKPLREIRSPAMLVMSVRVVDYTN